MKILKILGYWVLIGFVASFMVNVIGFYISLIGLLIYLCIKD